MSEPYKCSKCNKTMILWDMNYLTICDECQSEAKRKKLVCDNCSKEVDSLNKVIPQNKILYKDDCYLICDKCLEVIK